MLRLTMFPPCRWVISIRGMFARFQKSPAACYRYKCATVGLFIRTARFHLTSHHSDLFTPNVPPLQRFHSLPCCILACIDLAREQLECISGQEAEIFERDPFEIPLFLFTVEGDLFTHVLLCFSSQRASGRCWTSSPLNLCAPSSRT